MNNKYQNEPVFPNQQVPTGQQSQQNGISQQFVPAGTAPGMIPLEQSFIENILRLNRGKLATVYMSFSDSEEWKDKIFTGIIEEAGLDHILLSDPKNGKWYLLKAIYLDYITFDEKINYSPLYPSNQ